MKEGEILFSDSTYRRRLMTLESLDDLVGTVIAALKEASPAREANSWVFFTADNGFHSGQFTMPDDKRLPYEFDIRVPLIVRPPKTARRNGIGENGLHSFGTGERMAAPYPAGGCPAKLGAMCCTGIVLNIDLAPTLLDIAGLMQPQETMDGASYKWMLEPGTAVPSSKPLRRDFLVEYHGEFEHNDQYSPIKSPVWKTPPYLYFPEGVTASKQQDTTNNTYSCLRTLDFANPTTVYNATLFCRFYADDPAWVKDTAYLTEHYFLDKDAFQLKNAAGELSREAEAGLKARLDEFRACNGQPACGGNGP